MMAMPARTRMMPASLMSLTRLGNEAMSRLVFSSNPKVECIGPKRNGEDKQGENIANNGDSTAKMCG